MDELIMNSPHVDVFLVQRFSASALLAFGEMILFCGGVQASCALLDGILGFYPLDAGSSPLPSCDNQKHLLTWPDVPWGAKLLPRPS